MAINKHKFFSIAALLIVLAAIFSRFYFLDNKPPHHDEAINGWFVMQIWKNGFFKYDPTNYHGPLLFYLFQLSEMIFGRGVLALRVVTSFFSVATIGFILYRAHVAILNNRQYFGYLLAALFFLFSPASIFFSRSAIHEAPFVFFQVLLFFGILDLSERNYKTAIPLVIYGLVGAVALKETIVIPVLAFILVVLIFSFHASVRFLKNLMKEVNQQGLSLHFEIHLVVGLFILVLLFTGLMQNADGLLDMIKAFLPWLKTGTHGAGHQKGVYYWLELVVKNEFATLFAFFLTLLGLVAKDRITKLVCWFALVQGVIYSLIPYKTPWCLISIQWPFLLAAAIVVNQFVSRKKLIFSLSAIAIFAAVAQVSTLYKLNYREPIDMKHSYVYVQTQYDTKYLLQWLENSFSAKPELKYKPIIVGTDETWPFPWLFGDYPGLEYDLKQESMRADVLVAIYDIEKASRIEPQLSQAYWKYEFMVRDARKKAVAYLLKTEFAAAENISLTVVGGKK